MAENGVPPPVSPFLLLAGISLHFSYKYLEEKCRRRPQTKRFLRRKYSDRFEANVAMNIAFLQRLE
jgi:hypothetical protein